MTVFALLLAVSLSLFGTGFPRSVKADMSCSAICLMPNQSSGIKVSNAIGWILTFYLALCYWAAFSYVFPNAEIFFTKWLLTKPLEFLERSFRAHQFHERFMHRRAVFPSLTLSHLLQFIWWVVGFSFSVMTRLWGFSNAHKFNTGSEKSWGFGQLLAIFLIVLPLLSGIEVFFGK